MRCWCIEAYWGIGIHTWITYGFGDMHGVYECGWMETCPTAMDVIGWKWSKRWHVLRGKNLDATHVFKYCYIIVTVDFVGLVWFTDLRMLIGRIKSHTLFKFKGGCNQHHWAHFCIRPQTTSSSPILWTKSPSDMSYLTTCNLLNWS